MSVGAPQRFPGMVSHIILSLECSSAVPWHRRYSVRDFLDAQNFPTQKQKGKRNAVADQREPGDPIN